MNELFTKLQLLKKGKEKKKVIELQISLGEIIVFFFFFGLVKFWIYIGKRFFFFCFGKCIL